VQAIVEVETGESVNHLEALAEWAHFSRVRAAFHLYVPAAMVEVARRLCEDNQIHVHEIWSYHSFGDEVRFTLVHRSKEPVPVPTRSSTPAPRVPASPRSSPPARSTVGAVRRKTAPAAKRPTRGAAKAAPRKAAAKKPARAQKRK
jgi:hypothetical protein